MSVWSADAQTLHCSACGAYFRHSRLWAETWFWGFALLLGNEIGVALLAFALVLSVSDPLSWWSVLSAALLLAWVAVFAFRAFIPLREVEAPDPAGKRRSWRHRSLHLLLIALPFLQWVLPFVDRSDYQVNLPVAVAVASVAVGFLVYSILLNGRYIYYRGRRRRLVGNGQAPALADSNLALTLVSPCCLAGISLAVFYFQINGADSDLLKLGLIALAAVASLAMLLMGCYWAGRHSTRLAFR
ncbi:hypothetical protein FRZ44_16310 [Hypericibacter terrae]|uniref:Uncharacterized protein n=1 Tax=Hypericibacter terrae TaxID=2602015 RepID=A0A5J6MFU6_9PROT|nr:hypothetical protein FRZ44_16310 [Hypericibacter terrae]